MTGASLERRVEHLEDACYTELSPLERFRLILDAGARDDFEAADRLLWGACPTRTYRQADAAFSGRVRAAELICLAVYADLNYLLGRLRMAETIGETLLGLIEDAMTDGYVAGYTDAGGNIADMDDETAEESIETDHRLHARSERIREVIRSKLASHAAAIWQGFCLFAREDVDVEPEVLARSFMPPLADMQAAIADVQSDQEDVRECHEALAALWEQRLELYGAVAVG